MERLRIEIIDKRLDVFSKLPRVAEAVHSLDCNQQELYAAFKFHQFSGFNGQKLSQSGFTIEQQHTVMFNMGL